MDLFSNLRDFFSNELFADLTIYTFDSRTEKTSRVCCCHSLILASALPKMKPILLASDTLDDKLNIILEDVNPGEVMSAISYLYNALADGIVDCQLGQLRDIFYGRPQQQRPVKLVKQSTKSSSYAQDVKDDPYWSDEEDIKPPIAEVELSTVQFSTLKTLVESSLVECDFKAEFSALIVNPFLQELPSNNGQPIHIQDDFFMLLEVGRRQFQFMSSVVFAKVNGKNALNASQIGGNMVDMIKKVTGCSLEMILDSKALAIEDQLDQARIEQEQKDLMKFRYQRQVKLEQSAYENVIIKVSREPLEPRSVAGFNDFITLSFTEELSKREAFDFMVLTGPSIDKLQLQPFISHRILSQLDQNAQISLLLETTAAFCGLHSAKDLLSISMFKTLAEAHIANKFTTKLISFAMEEEDDESFSPIKLESAASDFNLIKQDEEEAEDELPFSEIKTPPVFKPLKKSSASSGLKRGRKAKIPSKTQTDRARKKGTKPGPVPRVDTSAMKCNYEGCGKDFKSKEACKVHLLYFHLKEGSGVPCEECGIFYQNFYYLQKHIRLAHKEFSCKECPETFIGENELERHKRKVHLKGNEHICDACGQGFKMKTYVKKHKRIHHPELVNSHYYCKECNRYFGTNRKLRDHMVGTHLKTRPYKCRAGDRICDKAFYNINLRRTHERQVHRLSIYTPRGAKSIKTVDPLKGDQQQDSTANTAATSEETK